MSLWSHSKDEGRGFWKGTPTDFTPISFSRLNDFQVTLFLW